MDRRGFLTIFTSSIIVPKFEPIFRKLWVPSQSLVLTREQKKLLFFAQAYGMGPNRFSELLKPGLKKDFYNIYDSFNYEFPKLVRNNESH